MGISHDMPLNPEHGCPGLPTDDTNEEDTAFQCVDILAQPYGFINAYSTTTVMLLVGHQQKLHRKKSTNLKSYVLPTLLDNVDAIFLFHLSR
jgi:hypothetical protein